MTMRLFDFGRRALHRRRELEHVDAGLQAERTAMAWQRTALGFGGVSALLLHSSRTALEAGPGVIGLLVTLALLVVAELRYEQTVRHVLDDRTPVAARLLQLVSFAVVGLAVTAGVLLLLGDPG